MTKKPDRVVLVRYIDDEGTRLEIEPTMKKLTVDGVRYEKAPGIRFVYQDGHVGLAFVACVPADDFARKRNPVESVGRC